jgi:Putative cyclase
MTRIVDLSMPIENHFRWPVERRVAGSHAQGDVFEATWLGWTVHGFTHMDAPRHCVPGGPTTETIALERTVGDAAVVDLTPIEPNEAITGPRLAAAAGHVREGDIVVMRSCWEQQRSPRTPEFSRSSAQGGLRPRHLVPTITHSVRTCREIRGTFSDTFRGKKRAFDFIPSPVYNRRAVIALWRARTRGDQCGEKKK